MNSRRSMHTSLAAGWPALLLAAFSVSAMAAAPKPAAHDSQSRYARESAACSRIAEHGARANCLSEASTRRAQALSTPPGESPEVLKQNALRRCEPLPDEEKRDCIARINGQGTVSGSVEGGGLYREFVTREVGVAPATSTAAPAKPASAP